LATFFDKNLFAGINLQPGQAVQIAVTPILTTASPGAKRRFSPKERKCYFSDEIKLHHLKPKDNYRQVQSSCLNLKVYLVT